MAARRLVLRRALRSCPSRCAEASPPLALTVRAARHSSEGQAGERGGGGGGGGGGVIGVPVDSRRRRRRETAHRRAAVLATVPWEAKTFAKNAFTVATATIWTERGADRHLRTVAPAPPTLAYASAFNAPTVVGAARRALLPSLAVSPRPARLAQASTEWPT